MRRVALILALLVVTLTACGSGSRELTGSLTLRDAFGQGSDMGRGEYPCVGTNGYDDIAEGAPVTVYDAAGAIVATGRLGESEALDAAESCLFPFTVAEVPTSDFYQVEVANRGMVTFTAEQVENGEVSLTLGG